MPLCTVIFFYLRFISQDSTGRGKSISIRQTIAGRFLQIAHRLELDVNQGLLVFERKSLTTKLCAFLSTTMYDTLSFCLQSLQPTTHGVKYRNLTFFSGTEILCKSKFPQSLYFDFLQNFHTRKLCEFWYTMHNAFKLLLHILAQKKSNWEFCSVNSILYLRILSNLFTSALTFSFTTPSK